MWVGYAEIDLILCISCFIFMVFIGKWGLKMGLITSQNGINLIKKFEGCRLTAYKDAVGVLTIGYGTTSGVYSGMTITLAQAENLLKNDLVKFEAKVNKYNAKYNWTQNQFDAMVTFAYNVGSIDQLTANGTRDINTIASKILEYNKAGGKVLAGLTSRRKAERELFLSGTSAAETETTPSNETTTYTTGTYVITASKMNVRVGHGTNYRIKELKELTSSAQKQGGYVKGVKCTISEIYQSENEVWGKTPSGWICIKNANGTYCKKA